MRMAGELKALPQILIAGQHAAIEISNRQPTMAKELFPARGLPSQLSAKVQPIETDMRHRNILVSRDPPKSCSKI